MVTGLFLNLSQKIERDPRVCAYSSEPKYIPARVGSQPVIIVSWLGGQATGCNETGRYPTYVRLSNRRYHGLIFDSKKFFDATVVHTELSDWSTRISISRRPFWADEGHCYSRAFGEYDSYLADTTNVGGQGQPSLLCYG